MTLQDITTSAWKIIENEWVDQSFPIIKREKYIKPSEINLKLEHVDKLMKNCGFSKKQILH
jgi:hypothetical protein